MAVASGVSGVILLIGRILFGGLLVFQGFNHFTNTEMMTQYAAAKGLPAARLGVLTSGLVLVLSGIGIVLGVYPTLAAGMLAVFFIAVTPVMHDFWAAPPEEQQSEMNDFIKNAELLGASLVFLVLSSETWAYALNIGL